MGFLNGSLTLQRMQVTGQQERMFGQEDLDVLANFSLDAAKPCPLDEPRVGFTAGGHLLDHNYTFEKNVIVDALHFGVRIDSQQIPAGVRAAWLQMELAALVQDDPDRKLRKADREQAKDAVQARCEHEALSGKYQRMQAFPLLWDAPAECLYFGGSSAAACEHAAKLMERAFEVELQTLTCGVLAAQWAEQNDRESYLRDAMPAVFHDQQSRQEVSWWNNHSGNYDFLGNEFLLWLWWKWEADGDTIDLLDGTQVSGMMGKTLSLECPLGEAGKETISADSPVRLPEAMLAVSSGKLPRRAGLTLTRNGEIYDLVLQAESFQIGGARIQSDGGNAAKQTPDERLESVRALLNTVDQTYFAFCEQRLGDAWPQELKRMRKWLGQLQPALQPAA